MWETQRTLSRRYGNLRVEIIRGLGSIHQEDPLRTSIYTLIVTTYWSIRGFNEDSNSQNQQYTIDSSFSRKYDFCRSDDGQDTGRGKPTMTPTSKKSSIGLLSYIKGVSEQIRRSGQYDVPACFKPMNTLRQLLVRLKDKILTEQVVGPVYHVLCDSCDDFYIKWCKKVVRSTVF